MTGLKQIGKMQMEKKKRAKRSLTKNSESNTSQFWELRLYVAGNTHSAITAINNLKAFCEIHLKGKYRIEVVDLLENPQLASGDQILAIPTLVRRLPEPIKRIIGTLSDRERVLVGLDIRKVLPKAA